ncbi:putative Ig domain-containing protein [Bordetella trematum]|uniref:RCC1 domain-containing protein n=1 Tax=Bordetella trematum TaxID=123899 RepID=UPI003AF34151
MLKKTVLSVASAALLAAIAAPAFAASSFYLVVPVPTAAKAPVDVINVALTGATLPSAKVGQPYSETLRPYLQVTGDPAYDISSARWSVVAGTLPAGLSLDPITGTVTGTPTAATTTPASFTVQVTYKAKDGQAVYSFDVAANIVVNLAGSTLPKATVNTAYSTRLQSYLSATGDAAFDSAAARWSLVEGTLPAGLVLDATTGAVAGTPTTKTTSPASFTVLATYKGSDGQAVYTIEVGGVVLHVSKIAAGESHTCAITAAGGVKCWGANRNGQLGDNSRTSRLAPVDVVGLSSGVASITTGGEHTCAVVSGAARCWGANNNGQLGDNSTTNRWMPVDVVGLNSGVTSVTAGFDHTCAITTTGAAKCWGANNSGKLGDNSTTARLAPVNVIVLSSGVASITAGRDHTCAVVSGAARCWGANNNGQLGDNSTTDRWTLVGVVGLSSGVSSISAGKTHTCAVTTAGGAKCWGRNSYGQLGNNSTTDSLTPVNVTGLSSGVASITAGGDHTCAVVSGAARCWGWNYYGQLGDNGIIQRWKPVGVLGLTSGVASVTAGSNHTCAVTTLGTAQCWGQNFHGQLGDGSTNQRSLPVDVQGFQ